MGLTKIHFYWGDFIRALRVVYRLDCPMGRTGRERLVGNITEPLAKAEKDQAQL